MKTEDTYYVVKTGDTLYALAKQFGTTVEQLQAWNHIPDPNKIQIGQRLLVKKVESGYVPFPGAEWFKSDPDSPIITSMAIRLVEEGCSAYGPGGPTGHWAPAHRNSYSLWQQKLGYRGADADGWPGPTSWAKLRVPYPESDYLAA